MNQMLAVGIGTAIFTVVLLLLILLNVLIKMAELRRKLKLCIVRENLKEVHYQKLEEEHEKYDVIFHDMKYVIRTLAMLAKEEKQEEIESLVGSIAFAVEPVKKENYCSHKVLNALLVERMHFAGEKGVSLKIEIEETISFHKFDDLDLIILFGNLLDNAILAESKVCCPKEIICCIRLAENLSHIIIEIENSYEEKDGYAKAKQKPTGRIGCKHGIGLGSIEKIVIKYGGIMNCTKEDGRYRTKIIFSI